MLSQSRPRLAWFSPVPPARSGIAGRSAELVVELRAAFAWNHPHHDQDLAELAVNGFDSRLYYEWPMVRALAATARLVAVHGEGAARELREMLDRAETAEAITSVRLGEGELVTSEE